MEAKKIVEDALKNKQLENPSENRQRIADVDKAIKAVETEQKEKLSDIAFFFEAIPKDKLETALSSFAEDAEKDRPLCLIPSIGSAKAGFLFTDQAMYFREVWGDRTVRIPYENITELSLNNEKLKVTATNKTIEWDITNTLLHEKSRKIVAFPVMHILKNILSDKPEIKVTMEASDPVDWPKVMSFHGPAILLGTPLMAGTLTVLAETDLFDHDLARELHYMEPDRLLILAFLALVPTLYAYGTELVFSFGRFIMATLILGLMMLRTMAQSMASGNPMVVPIGGGLISIAIVSILGYTGLAIYNWFKDAPENGETGEPPDITKL